MRNIHKFFLFTLILCPLILIPSLCRADDTAIFTGTGPSAAPNALILLDFSDSMNWFPSLDDTDGGTYITHYYDGSGGMTIESDGPFYIRKEWWMNKEAFFNVHAYNDGIRTRPIWGDPNCLGPFYKTSAPGHTTRCVKFQLAQDAITGVINDLDKDVTKISLGYMRFTYCLNTNMGNPNQTEPCQEHDGILNYNTGCNRIISKVGAAYADIKTAVNDPTVIPNSATPLSAALNEAKMYLDDISKGAGGQSADCSQKSVILLSDGNDTLACGGSGSSTQPDQYNRRKASVAAAAALGKAGYKVYVIGFGKIMPQDFVNTLNWMAYYGGTDNPNDANSGDTTKITPAADPCAVDSSNDPGTTALSGYAYLATDPIKLNEALRSAISSIKQANYSFSSVSVPSSRTSDTNYLYAASFMPKSDPFWPGHLTKYSLDTGAALWDAGAALQTSSFTDRKIYTNMSGAIVTFTVQPPGQIKDYLGVQTGQAAQDLIAYFRGDPSKNPDKWRLGDIYHSNPVTIGSPSYYFSDVRSPQSFINFRAAHHRSNPLIVVGANDGQFHAFADGGNYVSEYWSFIPPNLLPKLITIFHTSDPSALLHTYFVDGPVTVADVWLGTGDGKSKAADGSEWRTLLVFGEGRGVRDSTGVPKYLWSSSSSCSSSSGNSGFNSAYSSQNYPYYCGYYAFNLTDISQTPNTPGTFMWTLKPDSTQGGYLAEPWSRMAIGRVLIGGNEKWVGFIGGGYNPQSTDAGKGFFVVDLSNGTILWSHTKGNNPPINYPIPASPAIVDTDNDGFIDAAYVGDLGGNMWRFTFCKQADGPSCIYSNWDGNLLFQASGGRPIYTSSTVARDSSSLWVFWGTGDKENPTNTSGQNSFFAVKDNDRSTTYTIGNLQDISTEGTIYNGTSSGWYITLPGTGEKVLSDPTTFGGMVLFTTFSPQGDVCTQLGEGRLYALSMMPLRIGGILYNPGAGLMSVPTNPKSTGGGARSVSLGVGVPSGPVISQNPVRNNPTDLYASVSGGGGKDTQIVSANISLPNTPLTDRLKDTAPSSQVIHWRDGRIQ